VDGDVYTMMVMSPLAHLLPAWLMHGLCLARMVVGGMSLSQTGLQCAYRYLALCWDWRPPLWLYLTVLGVPYILTTGLREFVPLPDADRLRNPQLPEAFGLPLPPPNGFTIRIKVEDI
jgi:hypothetical protein